MKTSILLSGILGVFILSGDEVRAACSGSESYQECRDMRTGNLYRINPSQQHVQSLPKPKNRPGWVPIQVQRQIGNMVTVTGFSGGGSKRWRTYGRSYRNGDYRILGSDARGSAQRTCINGKCF
jgi:hypothetical protein